MARHTSRYLPLTKYLVTQSGDATQLTFAEIEALIGGALPASATTRTWWSNTAACSHARTWLRVGWRVQAVSFPRQTVTYRRLALATVGGSSAPAGGAEPRARVPKYARLRDYLAAQPNNEVALTFAEMEMILGTSLPPSAYGRRWWCNVARWSNAQAWLAAGWQVVSMQRGVQRVVFARRRPESCE